MRTGVVLARQGGALAKMLPLFRASAAGRLGSGTQWMSWIHIDDIARLFLHARDSDWPYFCDERHLEELTPEFLKFRVLRKSTREIGEGTLIDYRLNLNGIPMGWQSRIENWAPTRRFVDTQVKGPYSHGLHAHEFIPLANGTLMRDIVRYRLPFGWLGSIVAGWKVESQVDQIFSYRAARIAERFGRRLAIRRPAIAPARPSMSMNRRETA